MKARKGFVLRNIMGDNILSPAGSMIKDFKATVIMNDLSAFVWGKLQEEVTQDELLEAILAEYEVDRETASTDLEDLLTKFKDYGIIEA